MPPPITIHQSDQRIDDYLADTFPRYTVSHLRELIEGGLVTVDGRNVPLVHELSSGETLEFASRWPEPDYRPRKIKLEVICEDDWLLAVSKPAGIPVIPTRDPSDTTLIEGLLHHGKSRFRPRIVHRIDRDTSGVLVVAKTRDAATYLTEQFVERKVDKRYLAVVHGVFPSGETTVDTPIRDRKTGRDKPAKTIFRVHKAFATSTIVECELITGRMHQIRIHLSQMGFPLLVDPTYGKSEAVYLSQFKANYRKKTDRPEPPLMDRLTLHAWKLSLSHPDHGETCRWEAPLPKDWRRLVKTLDKYTG